MKWLSGVLVSDDPKELNSRTWTVADKNLCPCAEVWNEMWGMNFGPNPMSGKAEDSHYMALYNASWHALKSVSPRLLVGGPATAEVKNVADFVNALAPWKVEADFVSTHLCTWN